MNALLLQAALNNAEWCDSVCRSHGAAGTFVPSHWESTAPAPPLYPSIVTLQSGPEAVQAQAVAALSARWPDADLGVKDSFSALDLSSYGFTRLLDGFWLRYDPPPGDPPSDLIWGMIETPAALALWQSAWSSGAGPDVFRPALLADPAVGVLAGWAGDRIVAGAMVNRSEQVTGLSNVFGPPAQLARLVREVVGFGGDKPVVGWEAVPPPGAAVLGPMRVWTRPPVAP